MSKHIDLVSFVKGSRLIKALKNALEEDGETKVYIRTTQKRKNAFILTKNTLNKLEQLTAFKANGISCPRFTTDKNEARAFKCKLLFARTLLNSTNGKGIIEFNGTDEVYPDAPLYVEYIPKQAEYRLHVFRGKVIDFQQKKKRNNADTTYSHIRNLHNGYVYCRDGVILSDTALQLAVKAVETLGYFYGAVDLIYNKKQDTYFVLEVNSRPGLEGTTLRSYAKAIKEL